MIEDDSVYRCNFQVLLRFQVDAGYQVLKEHLETASLNATYTSKEIQNQMISVSGDIIRNRFLVEIHKAFFSVIADEATDSYNVEQLSIKVRFLENGEPQGKFLGLQECISGTTGEAVAENILSKLTDRKLEAELLRGQAYDGAGAMAGRVKGAASRLTAKYPKAIYTHCDPYRLNLCIVKCCSISEVNNVMRVADKFARFFSNSPKRQTTLEIWIQDILQEKRGKKRKKCAGLDGWSATKLLNCSLIYLCHY